MASTERQVRELEEVVRELDLVVFRLELPLEGDLDSARIERSRLRRDLERLRDRLDDVSRALQ